MDESLLLRLHLSQDTLQRLTYTQMTSLKALLDRPPPTLCSFIRKMSAEKLRRELARLNVPVTATEYSLGVLESNLKEIFSDWRLDSRERAGLLSALARSFLLKSSRTHQLFIEIVQLKSSMLLYLSTCGDR